MCLPREDGAPNALEKPQGILSDGRVDTTHRTIRSAVLTNMVGLDKLIPVKLGTVNPRNAAAVYSRPLFLIADESGRRDEPILKGGPSGKESQGERKDGRHHGFTFGAAITAGSLVAGRGPGADRVQVFCRTHRSSDHDGGLRLERALSHLNEETQVVRKICNTHVARAIWPAHRAESATLV